jgi:hypothetical protein
MNEVYLWKVDGKVIHHTDLGAAEQLDGLTRQPDKTVTIAEFEAADGIARIMGNKIVLGKTEAEKTAEENQQQITVLKHKLADTDYIAAKIAEGSATKADYAEAIAQRQAWRKEISDLSA